MDAAIIARWKEDGIVSEEHLLQQMCAMKFVEIAGEYSSSVMMEMLRMVMAVPQHA